MQRVMDLIRRVAKVDSSVVFEGERGTGKERLCPRRARCVRARFGAVRQRELRERPRAPARK